MPFILISRGDSTLRGHYPLETEVLKATLEKIVPYIMMGNYFAFLQRRRQGNNR
ncbi:four-carbon acid sugar kinase family protein [Bacillus sp. N9]